MSAESLINIQEKLLKNLDINELESFLLELAAKIYEKKQKTKPKIKKKISIHDPKHPFYDKLTPEEEKCVRESLAEYERGEFTTLRTKEDIRNFVKNLV